MNESEKYLESLFQKAQSQTPKASFEEVSNRLTECLNTNELSSTENGFFEKILSWKIQLSIIGASVLIGFVSFIQLNEKPLPNKIKLNENKSLSNSNVDNEQEELELSRLYEDSIRVSKETKESFDSDNSNDKHNNESSKKPINFPNLDKEVEISPPDTVSPLQGTSQDLFRKNKAEDISLDGKDSTVFNQLNSKVPDEKIDHSMDSIPHKVSNTQKVTFTISESSGESFFERIRAQAKKAGIEFKYRVHHQKKRKTKEVFLVRDFDIDMKIPNTNKVSVIKVKVKREEAFKVDIGWTVDENNNVIDLCESLKIDTTQSD